MNSSELTFFNHQLAGMLKAGVPLEGALKEVARTAGSPQVRNELELLEKDLAAGTSLRVALEERAFPELFKRVLQAGADSGDLPGLLLMLAGHYERVSALRSRLATFMVYPLILLACCVLLSAGFSLGLLWLGREMGFFDALSEIRLILTVSLPPVVFLALLLTLGGIAWSRRCRLWLLWRLPVARDHSLALMASTTATLLKSGMALDQVWVMLAMLESGSAMEREVLRWRKAAANGSARFHQMAMGSGLVPPMFIWLVEQGGENLAEGFRRAADVYQQRSIQLGDVLLSAAMPFGLVAVSTLVVAQMVAIWQLLRSQMAFF